MASKKKKAQSKDATSVSLKKAVSITSVRKVESKETIIKNLLVSLLPSITTNCEIHKSFTKLTFCNLNSFYGWINFNGFNGFGTYTFVDGSSYRGSFRNSLTFKLGRYNYVNGDTYEGEFLAGCRDGYGQYKTKRFRYDGYFKNGKFHGQGVWKSKNEEVKGTFEDGLLVEGEARDCSGVFMGTFDKSGLRKKGKFFFRNGNTYDGDWSNDMFYGFGIYNWVGKCYLQTKAQTKYVGYWLEGKRHSLGVLMFRQRIIICQWTRDVKFGAGLVIACNGRCYASPEMFSNNRYIGSNLIKMCEESQDILHDILKLTTLPYTYSTMEECSSMFLVKIKELVQNYSVSLSEVYPVRIPHYELCAIPSTEYNMCEELKSLQRLLCERYKDFLALYNRYIHSGDEYMNTFGLNLFYMDAFYGVQDVNICNVLSIAINEICHHHAHGYLRVNVADDPLAAVTFYDFFQHFIRITLILMMNGELKFQIEQQRPTFFGHLAMQVLFYLKMLLVQKEPDFLVREALVVNRPAVMYLLGSIKKQSLNDYSIRAAYKFLHNSGVVEKSSLSFIEAAQMYFVNMYQNGFLRDSEFEVSDLELVEVVMRTSQIQIAKEEHKRISEPHALMLKMAAQME